MSFGRYASPSAHKWSHPPSSTFIADDEVASLANKPLHPLSLADLVKYICPLAILHNGLISDVSLMQTRPSPIVHRSSLFLCEFHARAPSGPSRPQNPGSAKPSVYRGVQSEYIEDIQQLFTFAIDATPIQVSHHEIRGRDPLHFGPGRPGRDARSDDSNSCSGLSRVQKIHQFGRCDKIPG